MAKNVFGWSVGSGSLERAVSSGGRGDATLFGFGGATGLAADSAGAEAGAALKAGVGLAVGGAVGAGAADAGGEGMKGLAGAPVAGAGVPSAGLTTGNAFTVGAVVACAKAAETAGSKTTRLAASTPSFIGPTCLRARASAV